MLWGIGSECATALEAAELLKKKGINCTVINARFLKPFDKELAKSFAGCRQFSLEDHSLSGGLYSALSETLSPVKNGGVWGFGWSPEMVIPHGEVSQLKAEAGLTAAAAAEKIELLTKIF